MEQKLYVVLAQAVSTYSTYKNLAQQQEFGDNRLESELLAAVANQIMKYVETYMPVGGDIEDTRLVLAESTQNTLVFSCSFHHMNRNGFYDGYTYHKIKVMPSMLFEIDVRARGQNKNDVKDYLEEIFFYALVQSVKPYQFLSANR